MLTFIPQGGLGNRMRSIDAALALATEAETELVVQWHKDPGLNCDFTNLFEIPDVVTRIDTLDYNDGFAQLRKSVRKRLYRVRFDQYLSEPELMHFIKGGGDLVSLVQENSICVAACVRFFSKQPYYKQLRPLPEIIDTVDRIIPNSSDIVGVHIRRADHSVAIDRSPLELFENAMQCEIEKYNDVQFFIATDSLETEAILVKKFPGRIIVNNKSSCDRADKLAIKEALIDLYCLSKTRKIIGSYSSSFSEEAAVIGNAELAIMDNQTKAYEQNM